MKRVSYIYFVNKKGPKSRHSISQKMMMIKTKRTNTHLVVIVDVAHVALGLDAIVAVREYQRGLRRDE